MKSIFSRKYRISVIFLIEHWLLIYLSSESLSKKQQDFVNEIVNDLANFLANEFDNDLPVDSDSFDGWRKGE